MKLVIEDKQIEYQQAVKWFEDLSEEKIFVFEHQDVYTAGKSIDNNEKEKSIANIHGIPAIHTNRGGLWTWHGKGQVVVYFIYNLKKRHLPLSDFLSIVENVVIKNVKTELFKYDSKTDFNIFADNDKRGFWYNKYDNEKENKNKENNIKTIYEVSDKNKTNENANINLYNVSKKQNNEKFGFIGLRVSQGFVLHGISINYNNNLELFDYINPCGLGNVKITSIENILKENNHKSLSALDIHNFKLTLGNELFSALDI